MAKRRHPRRAPAPAVTAPRLRRMLKLLRLLARQPTTRRSLLRQLGVDQRTFYRDLEVLRKLHVALVQEGSHYRLATDLSKTLQLLPLPDPKLTLAEAQVLARGRTAAHRKLARFLRDILG
ncbi:MAG: hypothetical protein RMJ19_07105 [Gemmatales bacterium]|nr:hypothetical protein [Gemmatales bacterium]MDW8175422.1 hypothetical protein [Gemmatales bacterium]MDW8223682.1 hypothetical protein [Gemmatales bacterium]